MHIDFDHFRGSVIADEILNNLDDERQLQIIKNLGPTLGKDGNKWIYLLGEMPEHYLAGWGDTPYAAMQDFVKNFYNEKAVRTPTDEEMGYIYEHAGISESGICGKCQGPAVGKCEIPI
jgi:uncharacterized membrane protein